MIAIRRNSGSIWRALSVFDGTEHIGLGELGSPSLRPAATNAVFSATGERIRTMPITKAGFGFV
jgi:isoquinoline 1-oxidoreductase beta subunit